MIELQRLIPDEVSIRIFPKGSDFLVLAPPHLKKPYWVTLGSVDAADASFDTMEEAIDFIVNESLPYNKMKSANPNEE